MFFYPQQLSAVAFLFRLAVTHGTGPQVQQLRRITACSDEDSTPTSGMPTGRLDNAESGMPAQSGGKPSGGFFQHSK